MKNILSVLIALVVASGIGWAAAKWTSDAIDRETVQNMLRAAGDSAVVEYRSSGDMEDFVGAALADTVEHYKAEVRAATRIVVQRVPVTIRDTIEVPVPIAVRGDTAIVELPPKSQDGFTLADTLEVSPRPNYLLRYGAVTFDPDTVVAALLRTEDGIDRFTAAIEGEGFQVSVADAATLRPDRETTLDKLLTVVTAASCLAAGWASAADDAPQAVAIGGGAVCVGGLLVQVFKR